MRMLCCPRRPRFKASKPLPGGTANSRSSRTRFSCVSFRATIAHSVEGHVCRARRLSMPLNKSSVAASAKERITASIITQAVVVCQPSRSTPIPHDSSLARRRQSLPHRNDAVAHTTPATQLHGVPHRRCRQQQTLDGHNTELARRHLCASNQDRRGGKRGNGKGVARCPHKNDPERSISEILLKPQTLVHCHARIAFALGGIKQWPIIEIRPPPPMRRRGTVAGQQSSECSRQVAIEQDAHEGARQPER